MIVANIDRGKARGINCPLPFLRPLARHLFKPLTAPDLVAALLYRRRHTRPSGPYCAVNGRYNSGNAEGSAAKVATSVRPDTGPTLAACLVSSRLARDALDFRLRPGLEEQICEPVQSNATKGACDAGPR